MSEHIQRPPPLTPLSLSLDEILQVMNLRVLKEVVKDRCEHASPRHARPSSSYLTQCINQMVLESQLPHKIVNLLSTITN